MVKIPRGIYNHAILYNKAIFYIGSMLLFLAQIHISLAIQPH